MPNDRRCGVGWLPYPGLADGLVDEIAHQSRWMADGDRGD
jgi:hypothetical protein